MFCLGLCLEIKVSALTESVEHTRNFEKNGTEIDIEKVDNVFSASTMTDAVFS